MTRKQLKRWQKQGQAVLIVLLIIALALGFGLSIISQSITDVRISQQEQEASRAFNAAEAGIEEALKKITIGSGSLRVNEIDVDYQVSQVNFLEGIYQANQVMEVSLDGADAGLNTLIIDWVDETSGTENPGCVDETQTSASLQITVIKDDGGGYDSRSYGYNSCDALDNGMADAVDDGQGSYLRRVNISLEAADSLVRIRPIYNLAKIRATGNVDLPPQGVQIDSTATIEDEASKAIEVTRTEPAAPSIFDYVLFSGGDLNK